VYQSLKSTQPDLIHIDNISRALIFQMEYVKKNMFLPGQVEQWNIINNVNNLKVKDLPRKELKSIIDTIQYNYNYVLYKAWGVNCTTFQVACWKVFEVFLDKETSSKISLTSQSAPKDLLAAYHPS
jgi:hypothetical protein